MFEWMNKHKKDIMAYTLWLVIPSFIVLYGYGECQSPQRFEWVAKVNGEKINEIVWSQWLNNIQDRYRQYGQEIDQDKLQAQALDALITMSLNKQKADKFGIATIDQEVAEAITALPYFKDKGGNFDVNMFRGILSQFDKNPIQFEEEQREQLTRTKVRSLISNSIFPAASTVKRTEEREKQKVEVDYLVFEPSQYVDDVAPDADQMKTFFEKNVEDYRISEQRDVEYARFYPAQFVREATYTEYQLTRFFEENREKYRISDSVMVEYLTYRTADFSDKAEVDEAKIEQHFEAHKSSYNHPEQVKIRYIVQPMEDLLGTQDVSEEEIKKFYDENIQRYTHKEQVEASHILLKVAPDASADDDEAVKNRILEIRDEIAKGLSFEDAAIKYSEGPSAPKGGELGTFGRGRMVPPFEKAAFELPLGQVSEPVKTRFGYHLIKVSDRKEEGIDALETVSDDIAKLVKRRKAIDAFRLEMEALDSLDSLEGRYEIKSTDWIARGGDIEGLTSGERSMVSTVAFSANKEKKILVAGYHTNDNVFAVERVGRMEKRAMTLEEAREKVVEEAKVAVAEELAKAAAQADIARIKSASLALDVIASERNLTLETTDYFSRDAASVKGFGARPTELMSIAFTLNEGESGGPVKISSGYNIFRLVARNPEHIPEINEVIQDVQRDCLQKESEQLARLAAQKFGDDLYNSQSSIDKIAAAQKIDWGTTGLFTMQDPIPGIGQQMVLNYNAFQLEGVGEISDPLPVTPRQSYGQNDKQPVQAYYILRLTEIKESYLPEMSEVAEDVEKDYRLLLAEDVAEKHAAEALDQIKQKISSASPLSATKAVELKEFEDVDNAKTIAKGGKYRDSTSITGNGYVAGIGGKPWSFTKTALALKAGQVSGLVKCYRDKKDKDGARVQGPLLGVYILQVLGKSAVDETSAPSKVSEQLQNSFKSIAFDAWIDEVSAEATANIEYNRKFLYPEEDEDAVVDEEGMEEKSASDASTS